MHGVLLLEISRSPPLSLADSSDNPRRGIYFNGNHDCNLLISFITNIFNYKYLRD